MFGCRNLTERTIPHMGILAQHIAYPPLITKFNVFQVHILDGLGLVFSLFGFFLVGFIQGFILFSLYGVIHFIKV